MDVYIYAIEYTIYIIKGVKDQTYLGWTPFTLPLQSQPQLVKEINNNLLLIDKLYQ